MYGCHECGYCNLQMQAMSDKHDKCDVLLVIDHPESCDVNELMQGSTLRPLLDDMDITWGVVPVSVCTPMERGKNKRIQNYKETPCWKHFVSSVKEREPKVLITFGEVLANTFLGTKADHILREYDLEGYKCRLIATNHNSACNYNGKLFNDNVCRKIFDDVVDTCRVLFTEREEVEHKYKMVTLDALQFAHKAEEILLDPSIEYVGYDTESNTLDPFYVGSKVTSFSFAVDKVTGYNVYLYNAEHPVSDEERTLIIDWMKKLLTAKKVVVHNAKHEYRMAKVLLGFKPNITDDTMLLAFILLNDMPGIHYGLKYLAGRYASMPDWENKTYAYSGMFCEMNKKKAKLTDDGYLDTVRSRWNVNATDGEMHRFARTILDAGHPMKHEYSDIGCDVYYWLTPDREMDTYAGYDAIAPLKLLERFQPTLDADPSFVGIYHELVTAADTYGDIELRGIQVMDYDEWKNRYQEHIDNLIKDIRDVQELKDWEAESGKAWTPGSTQANADIIFTRFGMPVQQTTSKGAPSCNGDSLKALMAMLAAKTDKTEKEERAEFYVNTLFNIKKFQKVFSSYFIGLEGYMSNKGSFDGVTMQRVATNGQLRIHPLYNIHGIHTGRMSSSNPSLHTLPDRSDCKLMMGSAWNGYGGTILQSDYAQLELRLVAACAETFHGDSQLADAFRNGQDIHKFNASCFFGKPIDEITSVERTISKTISFGIVYGMGVPTMAERMGLPVDETKRRMDMFMDRLTGVKQFMEDCHKFVREHGYIRSMTGRIRWLQYGALPDNYQNRDWIASAERKAGNMPIQGCGSDAMMIALNEFSRVRQRSGMRSQIIGTIHDSSQIDVYPGELFMSATLLKHCMAEYPMSMPVFSWCKVPMGVDFEVGPSFFHSSEMKILEGTSDDDFTIEISGQKRMNDPFIEAMKVGYEVEVDVKKEWVDKIRNEQRWRAESFSYVGDWDSYEAIVHLKKRDPEMVRRFLIANNLMER